MNFDDKAKTWDSDPVKEERTLAVAIALRQRVPLAHDWHALEYGCGTGQLSFALQADLGRVTLADSSPGMLAVLQEKIIAAGLSHLHPLALDLMTDPPPAERYDLIYTLMTLHHVTDTHRLLKVFHGLLRPGGWLGIADLDQELALVQAEQARLEGRVPEAMGLYDRAIEGAREQGFLQDEALAAELAGQFYLGRGHGLIAEAYLAAAYRGYQAWGAMAKLQQLRNRHSFLRGVAGRGSEGEIRETTRFGSLRGGTDRFSSIKGETLRGSGQGLDLAAVIKAGQAISGEIARGSDRLAPCFVVTRDIGEPRGKPAPPPLGAALGADHPAAQLDRLGTAQRGGKG